LIDNHKVVKLSEYKPFEPLPSVLVSFIPKLYPEHPAKIYAEECIFLN
jgi:hypothetical protein